MYNGHIFGFVIFEYQKSASSVTELSNIALRRLEVQSRDLD